MFVPILRPKTPFNVLDLPGLFAWYKSTNVYGDNTNPMSGTAITKWADLSPNKFDFTETGSNTIFTANLQNGLPAVVFNTASNLQSVNAFLQNVTSGKFTIYIVMKSFVNSDNIPVVALADDLSNRFNFIVPLGGFTNVYFDYGDVTNGHRLISLETNIFTNTFAHCFQANTPALTTFQNNVQIATNNSAGTFNATGKTPQMGQVSVNGGMFACEYIFCRQVHSASLMTQVQSYLNNYWRLT